MAGNVRELDHAIERAVLISTGTQIRTADLDWNQSASPAQK